jgi:O-acetylserine/cysteine efflux transporter
MFVFGSAYPVGKLALNTSIPPILMSSLRMGIVFLCLLPFWRFKMPNKKKIIPLFFFSIIMGVGVNLFMNLSLLKATIISPIIIGAQLSIPFGILASVIFLKEKISILKSFIIFIIFLGIIFVGFDPELSSQKFAFLLVTIMSIFYAAANVVSRYLKELQVILTNSFMGFFGFIFLLIISIIFEGNTIYHIIQINFTTWLLIGYSAILVSILGHMSMFYLLRFYPVPTTLPFYSLFPIFGLLQTFLLFHEKPSYIVILGGLIVLSSVYILNRVK